MKKGLTAEKKCANIKIQTYEQLFICLYNTKVKDRQMLDSVFWEDSSIDFSPKMRYDESNM